MEEQIQQAITILNQGGIVIYPTDTAFGIGCRMDNQAAIEKLFDIRKRPKTQAVPVLVDSIGMAGEYWTAIPEEVEIQLLRQYWPGALTVVLPAKEEKVPMLVRGGMSTVGIRMPNHPVALALITGIGVPLLGPSANFHGYPTPYTLDSLDPELVKAVDLVLPGECQTKLASTVIDCTVTQWKVLRYGAISLSSEFIGQNS